MRSLFDPGAVSDSLAVPTSHTIQVAASQIHHPILQPIHLDRASHFAGRGGGAGGHYQSGVTRRATTTCLGLGAITSGGAAPKSAAYWGHGLSLQTRVAGQLQRLQPRLELGCDRANCRDARIRSASADAASIELQIAWKEWVVAQAARTAAYDLLAHRQPVAGIATGG